MDYWAECISEALDDISLKASKEHIKNIARWVEGVHDNYGQMHGHDCIPNPLTLEIKDLQKKLKEETSKVLCLFCMGSGSVTTYGPYHSSTSQCSTCRGEGRHTL